MLTTLGVLEEPLGNTRLHVARLVASLLYTSSASHAVVAQELCRLNTMDLLLVRWSSLCFSHFQSMGTDVTFPSVKRLSFSGLVLQVHVEQFSAPPSGALRRCHHSALCPWNETSAWLGFARKIRASARGITRAEFDWGCNFWTFSHVW